jgi:hypothetical protein
VAQRRATGREEKTVHNKAGADKRDGAPEYESWLQYAGEGLHSTMVQQLLLLLGAATVSCIDGRTMSPIWSRCESTDQQFGGSVPTAWRSPRSSEIV